jgi:tetratricopeptide (TPR) repeat protein
VGLPAPAIRRLRDGIAALARGHYALAEQCFLAAAQLAPDAAEVHLWSARAALAAGRTDAGLAAYLRAEQAGAASARVQVEIAHAEASVDRIDQAEQRLRSAIDAADCTADLAMAIAMLADQQAWHALALRALERCDPASPTTRLLAARNHAALGHFNEAAAAYRGVIARDRDAARAWWGLVDLKTGGLADDEFDQLKTLSRSPKLALQDRALALYALGAECERRGLFGDAFAALAEANRIIATTEPWDPAAYSRRCDAVIAAASGALATAPVGGRGDDGSAVIFIVGLPRSGSTLVEQVLAAHPMVEAASELNAMQRVIAEEDRRRACAYPAWVGTATAADWARLGARYLELTARWRRARPRFTDKMPGNWLYAPAIRAMLPGARIIDCRRDPIETLWSCWRQRFAPGLVPWAQDFAWLGRYWRDYLRVADALQERCRDAYRVQSLEALVAAPEAQVRELLVYCGLPYDARCLAPERAERAVRTASAAQVRQPMRMPRPRAPDYGALLDPLRAAVAGEGA